MFKLFRGLGLRHLLIVNETNQVNLVSYLEYQISVQRTPVNLIGIVKEKKYHNKRDIRLSSYFILLMINMNKDLKSFTIRHLVLRMNMVYHYGCVKSLGI